LGRDDHNNSLNNRNSLPQTPSSFKIEPGQVREELASEFAEIGEKALKVINQTTPLSTKARYFKSK